MTRSVASPLIGKRRIVEMDLWDADYLDMLEPAYIAFDNQGLGEFRFGCLFGGLDCRYSANGLAFTWQGHDEMDEASGSGSVELDDQETLSGEIRFHLGDESGFKARRW